MISASSVKRGVAWMHGRDRGFELDSSTVDRLQDPGVHPLQPRRQPMLALAFRFGLHTTSVPDAHLPS